MKDLSFFGGLMGEKKVMGYVGSICKTFSTPFKTYDLFLILHLKFLLSGILFIFEATLYRMLRKGCMDHQLQAYHLMFNEIRLI